MSMTEKTIIHKELIFLDEEGQEKEGLIRTIAHQALELGYVADEETYVASVLQREAEVPTAIGYDIAIPHGKTDSVTDPFVGFLRTKEHVQWTPDHEETVRLVFLIGVPETGTEKLHLKFISQVSKKLLDDAFRQSLLTTTDQETIFQQLSSIDI